MRLPKDNPYEYEQLSEEDKQQTDIVASIERLNPPLKGVPLPYWLSNAVLDIKVRAQVEVAAARKYDLSLKAKGETVSAT